MSESKDSPSLSFELETEGLIELLWKFWRNLSLTLVPFFLLFAIIDSTSLLPISTLTAWGSSTSRLLMFMTTLGRPDKSRNHKSKFIYILSSTTFPKGWEHTVNFTIIFILIIFRGCFLSDWLPLDFSCSTRGFVVKRNRDKNDSYHTSFHYRVIWMIPNSWLAVIMQRVEV